MKRWSRELDDPYTTKLLNVSLVRPSMEYCSCISTSPISCYQNMLESAQKQFLLFALRGLNWDTGCEVAPATKLLNVSLVRPSMEYCSCISTSQISCYQNMLESVQKQLLLFALRGLNWDTGCEVAPAGLTNPVPSCIS